MVKEIRIVLPDKIYEKIEKICEEYGVSMYDLIARAIVKVVEEYGGERL